VYLYSLRKAYDNGVDSLFWGGEINGDCFFREKDVLEDDYSVPSLEGTYAVKVLLRVPRDFPDDPVMYHVKFMNGDALVLTEDEWKAGCKVTRKTYDELKARGGVQ